MAKLSPNEFDAWHVYFRNVAKSLNAAGYDFKALVEIMAKHGIETPFTEEIIKEYIFKIFLGYMFKKNSITKMTHTEGVQIFEGMTRSLAENFEQAQYVPFPSVDNE